MDDNEIREFIHQSGKSLRELDAVTGVSASTLSRFLRRRDISGKARNRLVSYFTGEDIAAPLVMEAKRFKVGDRTFVVEIRELI